MNHWYKPKWSYEICTTELPAFFCLKMSITCISSINRHKWTSQRYRVRFLHWQSPGPVPVALQQRPVTGGRAPSHPGPGPPFASRGPAPPCVRSRHWQLTRGGPGARACCHPAPAARPGDSPGTAGPPGRRIVTVFVSGPTRDWQPGHRRISRGLAGRGGSRWQGLLLTQAGTVFHLKLPAVQVCLPAALRPLAVRRPFPGPEAVTGVKLPRQPAPGGPATVLRDRARAARAAAATCPRQVTLAFRLSPSPPSLSHWLCHSHGVPGQGLLVSGSVHGFLGLQLELQ
jgi:hypothetical protein